MVIFTICSNNYLGQAVVLGNSVNKYQPDSKFIIFLMDEKVDAIPYDTFPFGVIPVSRIEPEIGNLALKYDIVELNTSIKPRVFEYLFNELKAETAVYLDPDIRLFSSFNELEDLLVRFEVVLTPHIFTPIPFDNHTPQESLFLNYGVYNLGFIALRNSNETERLLTWWKNWTYNRGYNNPAKGVFVDQLPMNYVPLFFENVHVMQSRGYNIAPWNIHERYLSNKEGQLYVNDIDKLVFYHFSSFRIDTGDLPIHNYTRFRMKDRPDLDEIHRIYNDELKNADFEKYKKIPCVYVNKRKQYLELTRFEVIKEKSIVKRMILSIFRIPLLRKLASVISVNNRSYDSYYQVKK